MSADNSLSGAGLFHGFDVRVINTPTGFNPGGGGRVAYFWSMSGTDNLSMVPRRFGVAQQVGLGVGAPELVDVTASAVVTQTPGSTNLLTVTVYERFDDDSVVETTETFEVRNYGDDTVSVGGHDVFVSVRGNTQVRDVRVL